MRAACAGALAAGVLAFAPVVHAAEPVIDVEAVMTCRATAIAHERVADWEVARFGAAATRALQEQADFAIILGVWGAPITSVEGASRDMNAGERILIDKVRLINRLVAAANGPQGYSDRLDGCVPVIWGAVKTVIDRMMQQGANRGRVPQQGDPQ